MSPGFVMPVSTVKKFKLATGGSVGGVICNAPMLPIRTELWFNITYAFCPDRMNVPPKRSGLEEATWYWVNGRYMDEFGQITAWHTGQATPMLTP